MHSHSKNPLHCDEELVFDAPPVSTSAISSQLFTPKPRRLASSQRRTPADTKYKPCSPIKNRNYSQSIPSIVREIKSAEELNEKDFSEYVVTTLDEISADIAARNNLTNIIQFIQNFLSMKENFQVTCQAYLEKLEFYIKTVQRKINILEETQSFLMQLKQEKDLSVVCDRVNEWLSNHEESLADLKKEEKKLILSSLESFKLIERIDDLLYCQDSIQCDCTFLSKSSEKYRKEINTLRAKEQVVPDALCVSFTVATNKNNGETFCLISISSPEFNQDLMQMLENFIKDYQGNIKFISAEAVSKDFHKALLESTKIAGNPLPRSFFRNCAEKSTLSTLAKMSCHLNTEMSIEKVYNFSFYPKQGCAETSSHVGLTLPEGDFNMKLMPLCGDCEKILAAGYAVLELANKRKIIMSPARGLAKRSKFS